MLLKLLFSVNCQTTIAYRADHSLHFHHLWVRYPVNYIIPPHMWVRHTVRNVGPAHLGFSFFRWVRHLPSSITVAFRATKIPTTLRADVAVAIRATKTWKALCFPSTIGVDNVAFRSYQKPVNSESSHSCQT